MMFLPNDSFHQHINIYLIGTTIFECFFTYIDVLPSSLIDQMWVWGENNRKVNNWARSLACSTLEVEGRAGAPGWDQKEWQAITHSHGLTQNQITSWLVHNWSNFGARTSHEQIRTHKTHHGPNLGEANTFPLIVYFVPGHGTNTQMSFCPGTPKWESWNPLNSDSHNFGVHNVACKHQIEMRFKKKL